jgi:hypothetical protein
MAHLTGLLLGAGASVEAGMPLASELTNEIKSTFKPDTLRELNADARAQGGGFPDEVLKDLLGILQRPEMHYEAVLGYPKCGSSGRCLYPGGRAMRTYCQPEQTMYI